MTSILLQLVSGKGEAMCDIVLDVIYIAKCLFDILFPPFRVVARVDVLIT